MTPGDAELSAAGGSGTDPRRRWLVLLNPKSGVRGAGMTLLKEFERTLGGAIDLTYQFSRSVEDGTAKARRAVEQGAEAVIVVGGDGMVNSIGAALIGSSAALGVIPTGSGNGFARHFGVPLDPRAAVRALAAARPRNIDVGYVNGRPFFVTCSMAWDAALVEAFERYPVRGVLAYVLAGAQKLGEYRPQPIRVELDGAAPVTFDHPLVFTVANLTQFGGGARIAPRAEPDDGRLELVVVERRNAARAIARIGALFNGTLDRLPEVDTRVFQRLRAVRREAAPIQIDGEAIDAGTTIEVTLRPAALRVLVPETPEA
jgi:diacylglycerol kinase (ATP)